MFHSSCCPSQHCQLARGSQRPGTPSPLPGTQGPLLRPSWRSFLSFSDLLKPSLTDRRSHLSSLCTLPTGNCSPALLDRDLALVFDLPPLPRPDMLVNQRNLQQIMTLLIPYMMQTLRMITNCKVEHVWSDSNTHYIRTIADRLCSFMS